MNITSSDVIGVSASISMITVMKNKTVRMAAMSHQYAVSET